LKPGITRADIGDLLLARGLAIVRGMVASPNEYVLRLVPGKAVDVLAESRALYESGLFEWSEPNFIQELK
jgi:hypothetical protein